MIPPRASAFPPLAASVVALAAACATPPAKAPPASSGGAAAASTRFTGEGGGGLDDDARDLSRAPKALLFRAAGFPTVDAPAIEDGVLDSALTDLPVVRATNLDELSQRLRLRDVDVLVLPYGSAFPVEAWPRIRAFLGRGGGLAVLGGAPFHEPVRRAGDAWVRGPRSTTFAHDLLIGPGEAVPREGGAVRLVPDTGFKIALPEPKTTWALTLRLSTHKDYPDEHGSAGPRDAIARPLVHVVDGGGVPRGCPLVEIDHHRGDRSGGRWVLGTSDAKLDAPQIHAIVQRALEGASELRALPVRATIDAGDAAQIRVTARRFVPRASDKATAAARVVVTDDKGREVFATSAALAGTPESRTAIVRIGAKLGPGLHHVMVEAQEGGAPRIARTGFWVRDEKLFASGPKLSVSRDWLRKEGRPYPVVGTTYMASDVHRKFLFEPNPHVWDADFAEMRRRGIDFVRTGLWTAWSRALSDPGAIDEATLAALDAYVLSAAKHGIVVCFNLFAFLPLPFTGDNPYLDPRSLEGQREMLTAFASRYRGVSWIHWDLINEPSYAPRKDLWSTRAIGDEHERRAWRAWVKGRHGDDLGKIRALWRDPADDVLAVPKPEDFEQKFVQVTRRPRKARDFQEFKEEVVAGWAKTMRDVLHASGKQDAFVPLVTLGQDEGGIYERPTQQLLAASLDYTAVHTWWKNDDLLWDGVLTKVTDKPSLHQETGLMRLEDIDGTPWRTPEAAARLLERKIAYAFMGRGTGVVEWAWNVNHYMPIDEESTIGLFRPDGTAKPELDALSEAAAFFAKAKAELDDFEPDPVLLVVPHARAFLGKTNAIDASKIVVRALAERFGVVPTAISDLRLATARLAGVKLAIVPSPDVLDEAAAKALLDASRAGTKVLFTGAIEGDSYGQETPSLKALGLLGPSRPVAMQEPTPWSASGWIAFEGQQELLRRSTKPSVASLTGNVWHEALPLELGREREPLVKLLDAALAGAGVTAIPGEWGLATRVLVAPRAALVVVVNERPEAAKRPVTVEGRRFDVPVAAFGARLVLVERKSGRILAATRGDTIATH